MIYAAIAFSAIFMCIGVPGTAFYYSHTTLSGVCFGIGLGTLIFVLTFKK